jgi:hypothetical protein
MSAVRIAGWILSMRVMRGFAVALAFLCVGSLIQEALIFGVIVVAIPQPFGASLSIAWKSSATIALFAGPTGLIAGVWEGLFGRISARAAFVISSLIASAHLVLWITVLLVYRPPLPGGNDAWAVSIFLGFAAVLFLSFLPSMMACWKLIDVVRDKIPAVDKPPAVDVVQVFD